MKRSAYFGVVCAVLLAACWLGTPSCAQDTEDWVWEITPYYWSSDISGDATVRGVTLPVDVDFDQIEDKLDLGILLHVRTFQPTGHWGYMFDLTFMNLDGGRTFPAATITSDLSLTMAELGLTYSPETDMEVREALMSGSKKIWWQWLFGLRYFKQELRLSASTGQSGSTDMSWAEPMVGVAAALPLSSKMALALRGDVGGFSIGESEFTWSGLVDLRFQLSKKQTLNIGYKWLSVDTTDGDSDGIDMTFMGPVAGISTRF